MAKRQLKELAREYYFHTDLNQAEICEKVGIAERTLSNWISQSGWKEEKEQGIVTIANIRHLAYRVASKYMKNLEAKIEKNEEVNTEDIKDLSQIATAMEKINDRDNRSNYIVCFQSFTKWLMQNQPDQAKKINDYMDTFLAQKFDI